MRWRHVRLLYMDPIQEERVDAVEPAAPAFRSGPVSSPSM